MRVELTASGLRTRRSSQLIYWSVRDFDEADSPNCTQALGSLFFYPLAWLSQVFVFREGIEPSTPDLRGRRSTTELPE